MARAPLGARWLSSLPRFPPLDTFARRHVGPSPSDQQAMLETMKLTSLEQLVDRAIPDDVRMTTKRSLPPPLTESQVGKRFRELASQNTVLR